MPLYLRPPRQGQTPNYEIRGTYLGVRVERSAGTPRRPVAVAQLRKLERDIETGAWPPARAGQGEPTFLSAAVSYMQQGGERRYMKPLISHFGETPLSAIDQQAIDHAGLALRPGVTGATRNRTIYTPVQAVLRHAGVKLPIRRPKGAKGEVRTAFLSPEDASAIAAAAHPDLRILLDFLLYTGCRLGEALALTWDDMRLEEGLAWVRTSKNGDPRTILLRKDLRESLAPLRGAGRVFKHHQGGHLKWLLRRATLKACGIAAPERRPDGYETPPHRLR